MVPFPVTRQLINPYGRRALPQISGQIKKAANQGGLLVDNQQRQGADQRNKCRGCRYKAYLFKGGHDASPTQHLRMGKNKNGDSLSVGSLSDVSTEKFWDMLATETSDAQRRLSGI